MTWQQLDQHPEYEIFSEYDELNNILKHFITAYIIDKHTATEEAVEWIQDQIDRFLDDWDYGLKYGFLMPLVLCMQEIQCSDDPNDYSSFFTLTLELHRFKYTSEHMRIYS